MLTQRKPCVWIDVALSLYLLPFPPNGLNDVGSTSDAAQMLNMARSC